MERKKQRKLKVGIYRFWIEYNQYFEGESTRRMRKRAEERRLRTGNYSGVGLFRLGTLDLAGI
jgi:hypothetical protein